MLHSLWEAKGLKRLEGAVVLVAIWHVSKVSWDWRELMYWWLYGMSARWAEIGGSCCIGGYMACQQGELRLEGAVLVYWHGYIGMLYHARWDWRELYWWLYGMSARWAEIGGSWCIGGYMACQQGELRLEGAVVLVAIWHVSKVSWDWRELLYWWLYGMSARWAEIGGSWCIGGYMACQQGELRLEGADVLVAIWHVSKVSWDWRELLYWRLYGMSARWAEIGGSCCIGGYMACQQGELRLEGAVVLVAIWHVSKVSWDWRELLYWRLYGMSARWATSQLAKGAPTCLWGRHSWHFLRCTSTSWLALASKSNDEDSSPWGAGSD